MGRKQLGALAALTIAGLAALAWAYLEDSEGFRSAVLIELGAAIFLFGGLYFLETQFLGKRVTAVEERTEQLTTTLKDVRTEVRETKAALDVIGDQTREVIANRRGGDEAALARLSENVSRDSTLDLLRRALRLNAISEEGIRVRVSSTIRLVFRLVEDDLYLVLQRYDGEQLERWEWTPEQSPADVMAHVAEGLVRAHEFHQDAFDATAAFTALRDAIAASLRSRWGERPPADGLGALIEIPNDQWAITEDGLECLERYYLIAAGRVHEETWRSHMREKTWVDPDKFDEALNLIRALVGSELNRYFPYVEPESG